MSSALLTLLVAALAFIAIVGIGFAFTSGKGEAARKRAREIGAGRAAKM